MQVRGELPVLTVLCDDESRPRLTALDGRMEIRYTRADNLGATLGGTDALLMWDFFSDALRDAWPYVDRLGWVHVTAAGVDTLLFDELVASSVTVTNARGIFDRPIAEFVLMSALAHAKDAARSHELQRAQQWQHRETQRLSGHNALVIGTGAIGREIARLLRAVGMPVQGIGRSARSNDPDFGTVHASSALHEHVGWADYVVMVAPLTDQTRGMIDRSVLTAMRSNAYLINVGRGSCIVEDDLLSALRSGEIAGAALDVFSTEPLPVGHPLWTAPGVTVSPHMSGDIVGWRDQLEAQFVDNAMRFLDGLPLHNVVDKHLGFVPASDPLPGPTAPR